MAMFAWMFIEGMHLHNRIILTVFVTKPNYVLYNVIGWGKSRSESESEYKDVIIIVVIIIFYT